MTIRVSATEVKNIISTSLSDAIVLDPCITLASDIVDNNLTDQGLSTVLLKNIERYLAAHFVALTEEGGALISSEFGDANDRWSDVYKAGLSSTRFGQASIAMDSSGVLNAISTSRLKARFTVV